MSSFPDLLIAFEEAVEALKVKLSQNASSSTTYNGEFIQSIAKDLDDRWAAIQALVDSALVFETKALMDAYTPTADAEGFYPLAKVWNDTEANSGVYGYSGGAWTKTVYSYDIANTVDSTVTSSAVSGAAVAEFVGRKVFSYPFTEETVYPAGQESKLSVAIVDVLADSSVYDDFFVYRIRRNEGGLWEVQVRPTAVPDGSFYGRFYTSSNPETGGDVVDVHEFNDGNLPGIIAINWSKLENGFSTGANTDPSIMALDKSITSLFTDRYIGYKFPSPIDNRENTFSGFSSEVALDRDRVFSLYDAVGIVNVNFTGAAIPGKGVALEFSSTVSGVSFNMIPRLISGTFDAALDPGYSNYIFLLYVGDNKYDVVYKQGVSTKNKAMPAIPKDILLSQDRKEITIYFTKNLDESSTVSVNDFIFGVKSGSSIQITGNKVIITMNDALLPEPNMAVQYKNNGNLSDVDGYTINGFINRIYLNPVIETFLTDPIGAGAPYNWITYGTVNSHSSDGNVLTLNANENGGIRSTGMLELINSGDIIEVKYRCTSGNHSLLWYDENQQFTEFSDIDITQNEWAISRRIYKPINGIAQNLILASPVDNGVFEIEYIKLVKLC